ncbi:MAG TPA: NUDIX domain-containing protein [Arthrobacter sp.]
MTHRIAVGALVGPLGVLMCHRRPSLQRYPAKWDFPGGHIEDGETAGEALARELLEEVNIRIVPENLARDEHDDIRWFTPIQALELDLAHHAYFALLKKL